MTNKNWQQDWIDCEQKWQHCNWYGWTTFQLNEKEIPPKQIPPEFKKEMAVMGVYMVFVNNDLKNGFSFAMPNANANDEYGVLTIGQSSSKKSSIYKRINTFIKCAKNLNNNNGGHSAGNNFYYLNLGEKLNIDNLWVSFLPIEAICSQYAKDNLNDQEIAQAQKLIKQLEYELTLSYLLYHGDLPICTAKLEKPIPAKYLYQNKEEQKPSFYTLKINSI